MPKFTVKANSQSITPSSISGETKARFDALLKRALKKSNVDTKQKVDTEIGHTHPADEENRRKKLHRIVGNKNSEQPIQITKTTIADERYNTEIGTAEINKDVLFEVFKKPPVPLPRTQIRHTTGSGDDTSTSGSSVKSPKVSNLNKTFKILQSNSNNQKISQSPDRISISSARTFSVNEPTITKDPSSLSSDDTFIITKNRPLKSTKAANYLTDSSSNDTYNVVSHKRNKLTTVTNNEPQASGNESTVGDIIVHKSPSSTTSASIPVITSVYADEVIRIENISNDDDNDVIVLRSESIHSDNDDVRMFTQTNKKFHDDDNLNEVIVLKPEEDEVSAHNDSEPVNLKPEHQVLEQQDSNSESDEPATNEETTRRKRERKKWQIPAEVISQYHEVDETPKRKRKHKKKTLLKNISDVSFSEPEVVTYTYENIVGITVHKADYIEINALTLHPMVMVHIVDSKSGAYVRKSDPTRPVCFYYENKDVEHITPLMTREFNFKEKRSFFPHWEETLIINEDFDYLLGHPNIILFFEIMDFVPFSVASLRYKSTGTRGGWYKIAWAYLKLRGQNGASNAEKKVRLQLYKPMKTSRKHPPKCEVYHWWATKSHRKYAATLYVSINKIVPANNAKKVLRSSNAMQEEYCATTPDNSLRKIETKSEISNCNIYEHLSNRQQSPSTTWSRLPAQSCKIPNKLIHKLGETRKGCFVLKFNNNGTLIACATIDANEFNIVIYEVKSGAKHRTLKSHQGLVYALHWSSDDKFLLSASADCTVYIWNIDKKLLKPVFMVPHPAFVYCAQFLASPSTNSLLVATGCFDNVVRIWGADFNQASNMLDLYQELEDHDDFITSLCADTNAQYLYTSDNDGRILQWENVDGSFSWKREYRIRDLRHVPVNSLLYHPSGHRLLVHGRDGVLRMLDLGTGCVMQWFRGAHLAVQNWSCFSPCGRLIFAANEESVVDVWNSDTGRLEASYNLTVLDKTKFNVIHCIDYHPFDHVVAFCHYGHPAAVLLLEFDDNSDNTLVEVFSKIKRTETEDDDNKKQLPPSLVQNDGRKVEENIVPPTLEYIIEKIDRVICSNIQEK